MRKVELLLVRSVFSDEKKLSMAALSIRCPIGSYGKRCRCRPSIVCAENSIQLSELMESAMIG
jgi:hypothetical protein